MHIRLSLCQAVVFICSQWEWELPCIPLTACVSNCWSAEVILANSVLILCFPRGRPASFGVSDFYSHLVSVPVCSLSYLFSPHVLLLLQCALNTHLIHAWILLAGTPCLLLFFQRALLASAFWGVSLGQDENSDVLLCPFPPASRVCGQTQDYKSLVIYPLLSLTTTSPWLPRCTFPLSGQLLNQDLSPQVVINYFSPSHFHNVLSAM